MPVWVVTLLGNGELLKVFMKELTESCNNMSNETCIARIQRIMVCDYEVCLLRLSKELPGKIKGKSWF